MTSLLSLNKNNFVLAFFLSTILPASAFPKRSSGIPPSLSNTHFKRDTSDDTVLFPAIHWDHDHKDLNHLVPRDRTNLFYSEHNDASRLQQVLMADFELHYPSVALEHSSYVHHVSCSSEDSMTVYFNDKAAYEHARQHWDSKGKMVFIGYFKDCSPSSQAWSRSWSLVHDLRFHQKKNGYVVDAVVEHVHVKQVTKRATFDMGTYTPNKRDEGRLEADFGKWGLDFDTRLDKRLGLYWGKKRLVKRGPFDSVIELIEDMKDSAKDKIEDATDKIIGLKDGLKAGAKSFADKIKNPFIKPHTIQKSKDVKWYKDNAKEETPFDGRQGKEIGSKFNVTLYCVECKMNGAASFGGSVTFSAAHGIESGFIDFKGHLKKSFAIGVKNDNPYMWIPVGSTSVRMFELGVPGLSVPGLYALGPYLSVNAELDVGVGFMGKMLVGMEMEWPNAEFHYNLADQNKSTHSGWKPNITPIVEFHGNLSLNSALGFPFSVNFGISMFNGEIEQALKLSEKPTLTTWLKQQVDLEYIKETVADDEELEIAQKAADELDGHFLGKVKGAGQCSGAAFAYMVSMDTILSFVKSDWLVGLPGLYLFRGIVVDSERCLRTGINRSTAALSKAKRTVAESLRALPAKMKAVLTGKGGKITNTNVLCSSGYLALAHGLNGNVYIDTTPEDNDVNDPAYAFTQRDGYLIGDKDGRLFHSYDDTMEESGVSRLRLSAEDHRPDKTTELIFAPASIKGVKILLGFTAKSDILYPIACAYNTQPPKLFVVKDPIQGQKLLQNTNLQGQLTGGNVTTCQFIAWKTGKMDSWFHKRDL